MTERMSQPNHAPLHPHMGRRCHAWDYSGRGIYLLTLVLSRRGLPLLAAWPEPRPGIPERWTCPPTPAGTIVQECWQEIPSQWPGVELFCHQVMPDHFHGILFVRDRLPKGKTLGNIVGSFKSKSTSRILAARAQARDLPEGAAGRSCAPPRAEESVWAAGFVDTILSGEHHLARMKAYVHANPDRLAVRRAHPDLFRTVRDAAVGPLHFQALGNLALLDWPLRHPIQCSRADFAYRRTRLPGGTWKTLRAPDGTPLTERATPAFEAACTAALEAASRGSVLVSPCLSPGEREIARRAFAAGARVIVLRNKGFAQAGKPQGALFRMCAAGRLLLLAPSGWPWVPGEKPLRREDALALNRMARLLAHGSPTLPPLAYRGAVCRDIDSLVRQACSPSPSPQPLPEVLRPAARGGVPLTPAPAPPESPAPHSSPAAPRPHAVRATARPPAGAPGIRRPATPAGCSAPR